MPNIYTIDHPYYTPGKGGSYPSNPSMSHMLTFGNSVEESFPEHIEILIKHESSWNHIDGEWRNKRQDQFLKERIWLIELGNFLRTAMVDDVFLFTRQVEYSFDTRKEGSIFPVYEKQYYETDDNGKLIRLPCSCVITYLELRFRDSVDKTQFMLINSGKYPFNDEVFDHSTIKSNSRSHYNNDGKDIKCPCCKVNFDEEIYNKNKIANQG